MSLHGYSKSTRGTLKAHLEGQWMRGYGGPIKERAAKKVKTPKGAPREYRDATEPATLAALWPKETV